MSELPARRAVPPYVPPRTFFTYLDSLRAFGPTLPHVIDRDSMRTFSGSMQSWLLNAMRFLHMIDENGVPRPRLAQIVHAPSPDVRAPLLRQVIEAEYPFLKHIDLRLATMRQLEKEFEAMGAQGDTVRKCASFFLGLAKEANITLSPLLDKKKRRGVPRPAGSKRPQSVSKPLLPTPAPVLADSSKSKSQMLLDILDPNAMSDAEQNAVWTLIKYLKASGQD